MIYRDRLEHTLCDPEDLRVVAAQAIKPVLRPPFVPFPVTPVSEEKCPIVYRVLITDSLSKAGLKILEQTEGIEVVVKSGLKPDQVREELKSADAIIIRSGTTLTAELLDGQERLKCIARAGVGVTTSTSKRRLVRACW